MADYTFPNISPTSSSLAWLDNSVTFFSPLSGTTRTESRPGGRWRLTLTFNNQKNLTGASDPLHELEAYLFKLNGAENRAVIADPAYIRSSSGGVSVKVKGAGQTGKSLITDSWPVSSTVLYAGDRIGISGQMIPVTADVTTNGAGEATLTLAHPIRNAPDDNAVLELDAPTARYILTNKVSPSTVPGQFKSIMVEFEEAIS